MRKNAYKNKMTMSEYVRKLIILDNKLIELQNYHQKTNDSIKNIKMLKDNIGRND